MRPPLIYSEYARDNFPRLVNFAKKMPIFPNLKNKQSMVYVDNLCELIRLIIENNKGGIYYPQQECYIETSKMVADIAKAALPMLGLMILVLLVVTYFPPLSMTLPAFVK